MKTKFKQITREADLEGLEVGTLVNVNFHSGNGSEKLFYEGVIDRKDAFLQVDKSQRRREGDQPVLISWRSERKYLQFGGAEKCMPNWGTIDFNSHYVSVVTYEQGSPEYNERMEMIEELEGVKA